MKRLLIALALAVSMPSLAHAEEYWYGITYSAGKDDHRIFGSLPYSPDELREKMTQPGFMKVSNLVYFDNQQRVKPWSEWNPIFKGEIYIRTQAVIDFQELPGSPLAPKK